MEDLTGDPNGVSDSWLQPGLNPLWSFGIIQEMEDFSVSSTLSVVLSFKLINTFFKLEKVNQAVTLLYQRTLDFPLTQAPSCTTEAPLHLLPCAPPSGLH